MSQIIERIWRAGVSRHLTDWIPDKPYLEITYKLRTGEKMDWKHPQSFNQKLQWMKIYDRNPRYSELVDKLKAKEIAGSILGYDHIIPTIGVYDSFREINFNALPEAFVLKCSHDSGCTIVCKEKETFNIQNARIRLTKAIKTDYYKYWREYPYKDVPRKIIAEEYKDDGSGELKDYKIFCFDGEPYIIQVDFGRFSEHKRNLYDLNWQYVPVCYTYPNDKSVKIQRPTNLKQMLNMARALSRNMKFARIDFYICNDTVYFGEFTLFPEGGYGFFDDKSFEREIGKRLRVF